MPTADSGIRDEAGVLTLHEAHDEQDGDAHPGDDQCRAQVLGAGPREGEGEGRHSRLDSAAPAPDGLGQLVAQQLLDGVVAAQVGLGATTLALRVAVLCARHRGVAAQPCVCPALPMSS